MACRGVHFAITDKDLEALRAAVSDESVIEVIQEEIEERNNATMICIDIYICIYIHTCIYTYTYGRPVNKGGVMVDLIQITPPLYI